MDGITLVEGEHAITAAFDRPRVRNAISLSTVSGLEAILERVEADGELPFVLRGSHGWFASGGDLSELAAADAEHADAMAMRMVAVLHRIEALEVPTLCMLDGPAIGGGAEICLAFDMRMAAAGSYLQFPQAQIGISTGWGGTERLARIVGYSTACLLLLAGERVGADQAGTLGLVNDVWAEGEIDERLERLVTRLHAADEAGRRSKRLLRLARQGDDVRAGEREAFRALWDTRRRQESMKKRLGSRRSSP